MVNFDEILFDDFTEDMRIVAGECSIEIARKLLMHAPGVTLQIPYKFEENSATYQLLLEKLGKDTADKIYETLQGLTIVIPKSLPRPFVIRYLKQYFNGNNIKNLAIELGFSEMTIYNIINSGALQEEECKDEEHLFTRFEK